MWKIREQTGLSSESVRNEQLSIKVARNNLTRTKGEVGVCEAGLLPSLQ